MLKPLFMKSFLLVICLLPMTVISQSTENTNFSNLAIPKWQLINVDVIGGFRVYGNRGSRLGLQHYLKDRDHLINSDENYYPSAIFSNGRVGSFNAALNFGFSTGKQQREVRFGLNYSNYSTLWSQREIQSNATTKDSFELNFPNQEPSTVYLDSVWRDKEVLQFTQRFASVSAEYLVKTERTRVSGYAGFGAQLGVSIQQTIQYSRYQSYSYQYVDSNGYQVLQGNYIGVFGSHGVYSNEIYIDGEHPTIDAKTAFLIAPYLPVGVEYVPFLNQKFLNRFGLELKGLIGAEFHMLRQAPIEMKPFYSINFGLKYHIPVKFDLPKSDLK